MVIIGKGDDGQYGLIPGDVKLSEIDNSCMEGVKRVELTHQQCTALQIARSKEDVQDILEIIYNQ